MKQAAHAALSEDLPARGSTVKRKRPLDDSSGSEEPKARTARKRAPLPKTNGKRQVVKKGGKPSKRSQTFKSRDIIIDSDEDGPCTLIQRQGGSTSGQGQNKSVNGWPVTATASESDSQPSGLTDNLQGREIAKSADDSKDADKSTKRNNKEKKPPKAMDKNEATIKRLKTYVSGCGVRKNWSKEFADLPLPSQQIKQLKHILAELGMTGRYTMDQAKAIKKRRDLARELDDVLEFERKAGISGEKRRRQDTAKGRILGELDTDSEVEESSEDGESSPVQKRKNTASRSIMAYLAEQSGDDN